jgi:hypothetical protein
VEKFIAQPDLGEVVGLERYRRIDAVTLEPAELAERVAFLVHAIEAHGDVPVDGLAGVQGKASVEVRSGLRRCLVDPLAIGLLECAVEKAATRAATEGDRAGSFEDFDALRIVEVAKYLHVIAKAIDEEVRAGIHAANDELVTVAFALVNGDARHKTGDVGQVLEAVVRYELPGHDAERLRNVDDRGIDLGRHRRAVRIDTDRPRPRILCRAARPGQLDRAGRRSARRRRARPRHLHCRSALLRPARRRVDGDLRQRSCIRLAGGRLLRGRRRRCVRWRGRSLLRRCGRRRWSRVRRCGGRLLRRRRCLGTHLVCGRGGEREVAHRKQDCLRDCLDALMRLHDGPPQKCRRDDMTLPPQLPNNCVPDESLALV